MKSRHRILSLEEANGLLPELEKRLSMILEKKEDYTRFHDTLFMEELLSWVEEGHAPVRNQPSLDFGRQQLEGRISGIEKEIHELSEMGCILRNIEKGWVDFLGQRDGKLVYYCWKRGENQIQFYHPFRGDKTRRLELAPAGHYS